MKYGVIGTGWITEAFIQSADTVPGMELAAVYSRKKTSAEDFVQKIRGDKTYEVKCFTSLEEMAASDIDAVYIASPNAFHYEQSRLFLQNGKHVLCEKPATVTLEQMQELMQIAKGKGLVYMEALMMLYLPQRETLKQAIRSLGRIHGVHVDFSQRSSKYPAYLRGEVPNIFNPKLRTGGLMDLGVYCVYAIVDWFGRPAKVQADAIFLSTGADASGGAILTYPEHIVTMNWSKTGQGKAGTEIIGDHGVITIDSISQYTGMYKGEECIFGEADRVYAMAGEARAFHDRVTGNQKQPEEEQRLMLLVQEVMAEIRASAGIRFEERKDASN